MHRKNNESFKDYRERIKQAASDLKQYLKGKIIPGTESYVGKVKGRKYQSRSDQKLAHVLSARKKKRRTKRKAAHKSRMHWLHGH